MNRTSKARARPRILIGQWSLAADLLERLIEAGHLPTLAPEAAA